ncbi:MULTISPECIES: MarC family protein [unclassified Campylobacter]|uniref:MarC family protein n=1 Tax=unclassified Campylobacter TaxID=2593542 RepID=UPI001237A57A|nr:MULTISPECIES: MarC family protein [unclassified Campylobacter]KAA6225881.1 MarC family protein [Campylobacter sp. LR185c]KAA6227005.1 MarC family protein [Campylobacter sp. LR196d]KAA6227576.1 MarC family protein [Campylobacter sp. LR286c]KAA6229442.1 MarC family protein [Campylobacter sp. LR264d]KAA6230686.1 MarC family protein [Campylobacter sp. LR291e]
MFEILENEVEAILLACVTILAVLNPFGNLTQFLAMSQGLPLLLRKKLFRAILYTGFIIVLVFLFTGPFFMSYVFRINLDDLRVGGGLILIVMSIKNLLFSAKTQDFSHFKTMSEKELLKQSLVPMAFPMLIGPGTLATVIVISELSGLLIATFSVLASFLFLFILFHYAATIEKILGTLILHVIARITQVFIVAVGAKMMITGLQGIFKLI